jgi:hypothetical protein
MEQVIKKYRAIVRSREANILMDHDYGDIVDTKGEDPVMYLNRLGIKIDAMANDNLYLTEDLNTRIV